MTRATMQQRAERLNAAYELRDRHGAAKAVRLLAERYALSPVQARRYVRAAGDMDELLPDAELKQPITVRVPRHLVEQLRARARQTGRSLGSLVSQAIAAFCPRKRRAGCHASVSFMCSTDSPRNASGKRMGCWSASAPGLQEEDAMNMAILPPAPGTVAAYLRVSSRVQRDRETIASQREAVLAHAGGRGWTVPKERVFADDGFSGATLDRPALEALRDAVAGGEVETVLAWSVDRLSRNFAHQMLLQEEFARHGARIVFVQEPDDATPQGMLLRQMLSAISEYERTQIAERSRRGKIHRARQGSLNMISRPPYGYRLIRKTEACGARLEIDEAEAAVVRRIYDLYVREGLKMHAVSRRLDAEGIRPRHAERWPTATVAVILRNETYVGRAAYLKTVGTGKPARRNRTGRRKAGTVRRLAGRAMRPREEWIELPVPAIVEATVFAQAQRRRAENRRFSPRKSIDPTPAPGTLRVRRVRLHDRAELRRQGIVRQAHSLLPMPRH